MPELGRRGFVRMTSVAAAPTQLHFHRPRADGGYDLFTVTFDRRSRPSFYGVINRADAAPLRQPWGETIAAGSVHALTPAARVFLQQRGTGVRARLLPQWFGHTPFAVEDDAGPDAVAACVAAFLDCLPQADRWWESQTLGPNLIAGTAGSS